MPRTNGADPDPEQTEEGDVPQAGQDDTGNGHQDTDPGPLPDDD
ncbi:hypothetical protein [Streptomyces sp. NBC_01304]|nr:hypothetical protein OG430_47555 [Streptomyces sp. NBC_01304]